MGIVKNIDTSVELQSLSFDSPEDLLNYMKIIKYSNFKKLQSPQETLINKSGSCHDQTVFELYFLRKMKGIENIGAIIMIEVDSGIGQGGVTHSFAYYKKGNTFYYFENAWSGHKGIKKFNSKKEIINFFKNSHLNGKFGNYKKFPDLYFSTFSHKLNITLQELIDINFK